jgi:hypothetical protein
MEEGKPEDPAGYSRWLGLGPSISFYTSTFDRWPCDMP